MRVISSLAVAFALALPSAAQAVEGFVIGLEGSGGFWKATPAELASPTGVSLDDARTFTAPLDGKATFGANLHLGWNILGWVSIEGVVQGTGWDVMSRSERGGGGLVGGRVTYFPLGHFLPAKRDWDVGVELGGGYAMLGGPTYGMDGLYLSSAVTAEYYPTPWFSVALGYRHFFTSLDRFHYNFSRDVSADVTPFGARWGTVFLGTRFHLTAPR